MGLFDGTDLERPVLCDQCGADVKTCDCAPPDDTPQEVEVDPSKQQLRLAVEKRRKGKVVTLIAGLSGSTAQRQTLLTELKNHCGAGGSMTEDTIEIQGKHLDRCRDYLTQAGYRVRT